MNHTKGPWSVPRYQTFDGRVDVRDKAGMLIALTQGAKMWEDAALMAQAPLLLKAVKLALMEFDRISYQKKANPEIIDMLERAVKLASGEVKS